jgi:hypothetical protein
MKFKINKKPPVENLEPVVITRPCDCGDPNCNNILFGILRPQIKHLADTGETVYAAYMPADIARGMIEWLEERLGRGKDEAIQ